ncbi:hypothetical protein ABGB19_17580 [Mycobacterium sp. B14F4]|uniref:hypothetical protein n=1 Tax=Mycobacterium sp. B14F4 TaxID=3153565 RepID=UPI00325E923B
MREQALAPAENPTTEAVATTGLFLIFTAIIAVAVCLASWGAADAALAAVSGAVATFSFVASLVCFGMQSRDQ